MSPPRDAMPAGSARPAGALPLLRAAHERAQRSATTRSAPRLLLPRVTPLALFAEPAECRTAAQGTLPVVVVAASVLAVTVLAAPRLICPALLVPVVIGPVLAHCLPMRAATQDRTERSPRALLDNLVGNAVKYVAPEVRPTVTVTGGEVDGMLEVSVADNGIGIPPGQRERVFQPLVRAEAGGSYAGTGLGLAICRRVVERHGGRIWVDPEVREGTVVRFTLPLAFR